MESIRFTCASSSQGYPTRTRYPDNVCEVGERRSYTGKLGRTLDYSRDTTIHSCRFRFVGAALPIAIVVVIVMVLTGEVTLVRRTNWAVVEDAIVIASNSGDYSVASRWWSIVNIAQEFEMFSRCSATVTDLWLFVRAIDWREVRSRAPVSGTENEGWEIRVIQWRVFLLYSRLRDFGSRLPPIMADPSLSDDGFRGSSSLSWQHTLKENG